MTTPTPVLVPPPDPLTVLVPVWGILWGITGTLGQTLAPAAMMGGIPPWGIYLFFAGLVITSAMALTGLLRRRLGSLRLELWGQTSLGSLCLCYSIWATQAYGLGRGYVVISLLATICVASFWQAARLNAWLSPRE